jgi:hypothetical protein
VRWFFIGTEEDIIMKDKNYIIRQISVLIDNRPYALLEMARCLRDKNINLQAFSLAESRAS